MNYQTFETYGGTLNAYCYVKISNLKRLNTVWFHLYDILEKAKLWESKTRQDFQGLWWEVVMCGCESWSIKKAEHQMKIIALESRRGLCLKLFSIIYLFTLFPKKEERKSCPKWLRKASQRSFYLSYWYLGMQWNIINQN